MPTYRWAGFGSCRRSPATTPRPAEIGDAALQLHRRSSVVSLEEMTGIYTIRTAPAGAEVPMDLLTGPAVRRNPAFRAEIAYAADRGRRSGRRGPVVGPRARPDAPDFAVLASDCLQAGVYAAAGLLPQAQRCLARIRPWSGDVVLWGSADHLGAVDFFIAAVLKSLGERAAARRHAAAALDLCARVGNRPWERRARHLLDELGPGPSVGADEVTLVGRIAETGRLDALLDRAAAGSGGVVVVGRLGRFGTDGDGRSGHPTSGRGEASGRTRHAGAGPAPRSAWAQVLRDLGAHDLADRLLGDVRPDDLDAAAVALCSPSPRLVVIDDLDEGGAAAVEVLAVLAGRVASSSLAVVVTSLDPLRVGDDLWLGPLTPAQVAAVTGVDGPDVVQAIWTAARGRPGPAQHLARVLGTLDGDRDPVVGLALSVASDQGFLDLDVGLIRLLEAALLRVRDDLDRARLLAKLASALLGDAAAAARRRRLVDEALRLARAADDPTVLAEVLDARLHALWDPEGARDRLDSATEIIDLARRSADLERERRGLFWRFVALMELARVDEAESVLAAFASQARSAGDSRDEVMALARHAMLAMLRGSFDDALRLTDRVDEQGRSAGLPDTDRLVGTLRGEIAGLRGDRPSDGGSAGIDLLREFERRIPGHFYDATVAFLLLHFGRHDEARLQLDRALPGLLAGSGPRWLGAAAELADVAASTGSNQAATALLDALAGYSGRLVVFAGANSTLGPVDHWLGVLAASLGRTDAGDRSADQRGRAGRAGGARPFLAFSLAALADVRSARGAGDDARLATEDRRRAAELARQLGLAGLDASLSPQTDVWLLRADEDDWELQAGAEHARLPDGRGVRYLRMLLASPGQELRSIDLAAGGAGLVTTEAEPVLDDLARRAYRQRLSDLETELDDADAHGDEIRAARAETERTALLAELRRASGLGGRPRTVPAEDERARVNVTRALRAAIGQISAKAPLAGCPPERVHQHRAGLSLPAGGRRPRPLAALTPLAPTDRPNRPGRGWTATVHAHRRGLAEHGAPSAAGSSRCA